MHQTGDKGAEALGRSLCTNHTLKTLYLSGNCIGHVGARALANALTRNQTLTALHLTGNSVGSVLAEGLAHNQTLSKVRSGARSKLC